MNIVQANDSDRIAIQDFLRKNWSENHIFVRDSEFFNFEMSPFGAINFILAKNNDGEIVGLVGFTQNHSDLSNSNVFLVMLRVLSDYAKIGLSFKLINSCVSLTNGFVSTVGANVRALPLYKLLGFSTGYLEHYYWINPRLTSYKICIPPPNTASRKNETMPDEVSCFSQVDVISKASFQPLSGRRDFESFTKRYVEHPKYKYKFVLSAGLNSLLVCREVRANGSKALKVIDYFGDVENISLALRAVKKIALINNYEFVDIYVKGIEERLFIDAGFVLNTQDESIIIPNYFTPFIQNNVKVSYATRNEELILMRGDGDQDRPS